jgi:putative tryptophan/tyrosine transport system substrate-binding protein
MRRREFLGLAGFLAAWTRVAHAQPLDRTRRVAILMPYPESDGEVQARVAAMRVELRKLGWLEGKNLHIEERWATDNLDRVRAHAADLVKLDPDVIFITGGRVVPIVRQQTRSIPTVFVGVTDPLGQGYVDSLARPGGNITGIASPEYSVVYKLLELLKEIAPNVQRAALVSNPENTSTVFYRRHFETAAPALGVQPVIMPVQRRDDIERAFETFAQQPHGGLVFPSDLTLLAHRQIVTALALRHRLPAIYSDRAMVTAGGLASYSADRTTMFQQGAVYVDRILRGEQPGDLPVQQPTRYELVVNAKIATALGLEIPTGLVARADEVVE